MSESELPVFQEPEENTQFDVLFIVNEHSGDEHAARLLKKCKAENPELKFAALGGENLREAGAHILYNPLESAVVGFVEVIKHLDFFKELLRQTLQWIVEHQPRLVCFVDAPSFNLRIAKQLFKAGVSRKAGGNVGLAFYISPQIWAWKAGRRFKMAKHLDALGVIFPFEVDCYKDTMLPVEFVGHPFVDPAYELPVKHDPGGKVLLLPGSRKTPISRIFPVMVDTFYLLKDKFPQFKATVMYPTEEIKSQLTEIIETQGNLKDFELMKNTDTFKARVVLTSSGTISLVCALASIPGVLMYRTNSLTYLMAKILVKVKYIGIANLILGKPVHKEFLQNQMQPAVLADELMDQLRDPDVIQKNQDLSAELRNRLQSEDSTKSAKWLLALL